MSSNYRGMKKITREELKIFLKTHNEIVIEEKALPIGQPKTIVEFQPSSFKLERTNAWSFPDREKWATHAGDFRGNWPPQLVRNIVLRFSKPNELVLDQMCGSGTTLIECKLLDRNGIGVDINPNSVMLTLDRTGFECKSPERGPTRTEIETCIGDARNLDLINDDNIDLIATHPPYAGIISYSKNERVAGDLSALRNIDRYVSAMREIASESYRVLRPRRYCAILEGDTRKHRHHVPIAFRVMQAFLDVGFLLREDIMKNQWRTTATRERWEGLSKTAEECWIDADEEAKRGRYTDFLLLYHEHLFVFRKPKQGEDVRKLKYSARWRE